MIWGVPCTALRTASSRSAILSPIGEVRNTCVTSRKGATRDAGSSMSPVTTSTLGALIPNFARSSRTIMARTSMSLRPGERGDERVAEHAVARGHQDAVHVPTVSETWARPHNRGYRLPMPTTAQTFESHSPADGRVIGTFPIMDAEAVRDAVDRGRIAASWWVSLGFDERKARLLRFKALLAKRSKELAELVHAETGKPTDDAMLEIVLAVDHLAWAAKHAKPCSSAAVSTGAADHQPGRHVQYQPLGVVGVIGPWNYPVFTPDRLDRLRPGGRQRRGVQADRVHAGRSGSGWSPARTRRSRAARRTAGGRHRPRRAPAPRCARRGVDKIAFTGSTPTGKKIMAAAADSLTPVLIECGGKDALIVDADADLDAAADAATWGGMSNAGQTCVGVERVYVHHDVYDEFVDKVVAEVAEARRPAPRHGADIGPITMPSQLDVIRGHIADALDRGGRALVGGQDSVGERYVEPTVLVDVPENCRRRHRRDLRARRSPSPGEPTWTRPSTGPTPPATAWRRRSSRQVAGTGLARRLRSGMAVGQLGDLLRRHPGAAVRWRRRLRLRPDPRRRRPAGVRPAQVDACVALRTAGAADQFRAAPEDHRHGAAGHVGRPRPLAHPVDPAAAQVGRRSGPAAAQVVVDLGVPHHGVQAQPQPRGSRHW